MDLIIRAKKLWKLLTTGGLTGMDKLVLILAVLYFLSPFDIIPDVIPIAGFLDDLVVALMAFRRITGKHDTTPNSRDKNNPDDATPIDVKVV